MPNGLLLFVLFFKLLFGFRAIQDLLLVGDLFFLLGNFLEAILSNYNKPNNNRYVKDGTTSIMIALVLFILPADNPFVLRRTSGQYSPILTWKDMEKFSWGTIFLLGGSFAMAKGKLLINIKSYIQIVKKSFYYFTISGYTKIQKKIFFML